MVDISSGSETPVNTTTTGNQLYPDVAALAGGGYVVTWTSDGDSYDVYAQRFDDSGARVGLEFRVNTFTTNNQWLSKVTGIGDVGYVVTWTSEGQSGRPPSVYAQRFDSLGTPIGPETLLTGDTAYRTGDAEIGSTPDGGYFVVYSLLTSTSASDARAFLQHFDADGMRIGPRIALEGIGTSVTALNDGSYIQAWAVDDETETEILGQRLATDGTPIGTPFSISSGSPRLQKDPAVVSLNDGGFLAVWEAHDSAPNYENTYMRRFDTSGTPVGAAQLVNQTTVDSQRVGDVTVLLDGSYIITWQSSAQDGSGDGVYARYFSPDGSPLGGEQKVNDVTAGYQENSAIVTLIDGSVVVVWQSPDLSGVGISQKFYVGEAVGTPGDDILGGTAANDTIRGLAGNDVLTGYDGGDFLDGGLGADTMVGGSGDDIYLVDDTGDSVVELASGGTDLVRSLINYDLSATVENLSLIGSTHINATGNNGQNVLRGNFGNNIIDGLGGADTMIGSTGDDSYFVDDVGDVAIEATGAGTDIVYSTVTYSLASQFIENLSLLGLNNIDATGNSLANILNGNSGDNALNGGGGADAMIGGAGNDTYIVDNAGDSVTELAGGGIDLIRSSRSLTLVANVENLTLTGVANLSGSGNTQNNVITGNSGNNGINGRQGADTMLGRAGDDTYTVDNVGDIVTELRGQGTDEVKSSVDFNLIGYVENLTLAGSTSLSGVGNSLSNVMIGNDGNNSFRGRAGADILDGGRGNDILRGNEDGDTFVFGANSGNDIIRDFSVAENDRIDVSAYSLGVVNGGGIVFSQLGANTLIDLGGGNTVLVESQVAADPAFQGYIIW